MEESRAAGGGAAYTSAMEDMGDQHVQVMMPYADSLKYMADWFCQLWAESLWART